MEGCVFCRIVRKELPAHILYEDDLVLAFLDRQPVRQGHAMVIPQQHVDHFIDLDDKLAAHICMIANRIGRKIQSELKPKRVGFAVAGFGVPHAHYHIVPMFDEFDVTSARYAKVRDGAVIYTMDHIEIPYHDTQSDIAERLKL